jgi:hypothetical protein
MNLNYRYVLIMLASLFAITANGAPMAFSVNSDSGNLATEDSLYVIDLESGAEQRVAKLFNGIDNRTDTEGLAISPNQQLWGIDDDSGTLFLINPESAAVDYTKEIALSSLSLSGFPAEEGNDFGMTFSCDNDLYITSVRTSSLYRVNLDSGTSEVVGTSGALGANISAIASIGKPGKLYGLGNGQFQNGETDSPNLYSIDTQTGVATLIGPLGNEAGEYNQGGLAFDNEGVLWAITDRRIINNSIANLPSQILKLDTTTGTASLVATTSDVGFESLAIAAPMNCAETVVVEEFDGIPSLNPAGRILAIFVLMLAGIFVLRQRLS